MESCKNVARVTISEEQYVADWISTLFNSSPSRSLSFPLLLPPSSSFFSPCVTSSPAASPLSSCSPAHLHAPRVTYTGKMASHTLCPWYKLQVIAARGEGSPPPPRWRGEREKGRPRWRACETANFMIYKRDPL